MSEEEKSPEAPPKKAGARPRRRKPSAERAEKDETTSAQASEGGETGESDVKAPATAPILPVTFARERAARRALGAGGLLAALGLALVGTGPSEAGTVLCVAGLLVLIYGIHTFGRLGPEPAK